MGLNAHSSFVKWKNDFLCAKYSVSSENELDVNHVVYLSMSNSCHYNYFAEEY